MTILMLPTWGRPETEKRAASLHYYTAVALPCELVLDDILSV